MEKVKFHHFGLAVKNFSKSIQFYKNLGYHLTEAIVDPLQNVELVFCTHKIHPSIELVKPINSDSPIMNYLIKNNEIIYHTCYEVINITEGINLLFPNIRVFCVSKPKPAILFNNRLVAFYYVNNVGLIELLQSKK